VDSILDVQEVLVRNLGRRGGRWYGVAGAAELQDDRVALVLDLSRLLGESPFESAVGQLSDAL
jgi:chemotaxis protein histidine kinase CheA